MPYVPMPNKPTYRQNRWDPWGDAVGDNVSQLVQDVPALQTAVAALQTAIAAGVATRSPFVKPTAQGVWPRQTRSSTDTLMWLRNITATTLAPIPTAADGYLPGDLVFPVATGDTLPTAQAGVLFSDSFVLSATVQLDGRYGDKALGGAEPAWRADLSANPDGARARVQPNTGLELYSNAYAYVLAPKVPTTGNLRVSAKMQSLAANNQFAFILRGSAYNAADTVILLLRNVSGQLSGSIIDRSSGSTVTTPLGTATFTPGTTTVTLTMTGQALAVDIGGQALAAYTIPAAAIRMSTFAVWADMYSSVSMTQLKVEVI